VANTNDPPQITSSPVKTATQDVLYTYDVEATDPDAGDTLTYSLTTAPSGMSIDSATGVIQWTPTNEQIGDNGVVVQVADVAAATDMQSFTITVNPSEPQTTTLTIVDGYDEKNAKTLSEDGKVNVVTASDADRWETEYGYYTSYQFSNLPPEATTIISVTIYCRHYEEKEFEDGNLEWKVGSGWQVGSSTVWGSTSLIPINREEDKEATDSWDVNSWVSTPSNVNDMEFCVKNNDNIEEKKTKVNYIYAVVEWY